MDRPGDYITDTTEGITRVEDLPPPHVEHRSRDFRRRKCPRCGRSAPRCNQGQRTLHDLGNVRTGRPIDIVITYSKHHCLDCRRCFNADMADLALPKCHYTHRVQQTAVRLVSRTVCRTDRRAGTSGAITASSSPGPPARTGSRLGGKKAAGRIEADYLTRGLENFSGYIAVDELYDGPFCVLSLVDNRTFTRLMYRVLEKDPTQDDIRALLRDFKAHLDARGLKIRGVTTDGSNLYPAPLEEIFPAVPHQVCRFHVLKEITKAVLHALAELRKEMKARLPKRPRGRPKKDQSQEVRRAERQEQRINDLFEHRHLFVRRKLTAAEGRTLQRITRGLPQLRVLRSIMEEVYRLFDRRCRAATALARLAKLRARVRRFKRIGRALEKLSTPHLEKALTYLDDKLLPGTSNAVERGNRRYRKAQRSIYSVRTAPHIRQRIALDMHREQRSGDRLRTTKALHQARAGP